MLFEHTQAEFLTFEQGKPMTLKPSIIVYKIAKLDEQETTITLNFLLSIYWHDTRISLESNGPNNSVNWYAVNKLDQTEIYTPTLAFSGTKTILRTKNSGAKDNDYFWYYHPDNLMEYRQSLKTTIYCSIDFRHFPFDSHTVRGT